MVAIKNGRQEELIWENNYREGRRRRAWRRRRRRWAWPSAQKSAGNTNGVHSKDWSYPAESAGHWRSSTRGQSMTFNVPVSAKKKIISERGDLHANGPRAYHLQLLRGAVGSCALFSARVSFSFLWFLGQKKGSNSRWIKGEWAAAVLNSIRERCHFQTVRGQFFFLEKIYSSPFGSLFCFPRSPVLIDAVRVTIKQKSRDFPISKKVSRSQAHEESVFKGNRE